MVTDRERAPRFARIIAIYPEPKKDYIKISDSPREAILSPEDSRIINDDLIGLFLLQAFDNNQSWGDEKELPLLVRKNLGLAVKWAKKYQNKGLPLLDLIQEASRGLAKAATTYEPEKGAFSTHAVFWIKKFILKALAKHQPLPLSQDGYLKVRWIYAICYRFIELNGYRPSPQELTAVLNQNILDGKAPKSIQSITEQELNLIMTSTDYGLSLNIHGGRSLINKIADPFADPEEEYWQLEARLILEKQLTQHLSAKEQFVLIHRFGLIDGIEKSRTRVAAMLVAQGFCTPGKVSLSPQAVEQIEKRSLAKLGRDPQTADILELLR